MDSARFGFALKHREHELEHATMSTAAQLNFAAPDVPYYLYYKIDIPVLLLFIVLKICNPLPPSQDDIPRLAGVSNTKFLWMIIYSNSETLM